MEIRIKRGNSLRRIWWEMVSGLTRVVTLRINPILVMLEPTALPSARFGLFCIAAWPEIGISGAELPRPIITSPINRGGRPRWAAVAAEPSMNQSALKTIDTRPNTKTIRANDRSRWDLIFEWMSLLPIDFKWNDPELGDLYLMLTLS